MNFHSMHLKKKSNNLKYHFFSKYQKLLISFVWYLISNWTYFCFILLLVLHYAN